VLAQGSRGAASHEVFVPVARPHVIKFLMVARLVTVVALGLVDQAGSQPARDEDADDDKAKIGQIVV
jgi:hypothetical protein